MLQDGVLQEQWIFEETFPDNNHSAAVCKEAIFTSIKYKINSIEFQKKLPRGCIFRDDPDKILLFSVITFETLLEHAQIVNPLPEDGGQAYEEFLTKPRKLF